MLIGKNICIPKKQANQRFPAASCSWLYVSRHCKDFLSHAQPETLCHSARQESYSLQFADAVRFTRSATPWRASQCDTSSLPSSAGRLQPNGDSPVWPIETGLSPFCACQFVLAMAFQPMKLFQTSVAEQAISYFTTSLIVVTNIVLLDQS